MKQLKPKLTPLPCPFCGAKPKVGPTNPDRDGNAWGYVQCASKRCPINPRAEDGQEMADERGTGAYIDCAIKRWNKRKVAP